MDWWTQSSTTQHHHYETLLSRIMMIQVTTTNPLYTNKNIKAFVAHGRAEVFRSPESSSECEVVCGWRVASSSSKGRFHKWLHWVIAALCVCVWPRTVLLWTYKYVSLCTHSHCLWMRVCVCVCPSCTFLLPDIINVGVMDRIVVLLRLPSATVNLQRSRTLSSRRGGDSSPLATHNVGCKKIETASQWISEATVAKIEFKSISAEDEILLPSEIRNLILGAFSNDRTHMTFSWLNHPRTTTSNRVNMLFTFRWWMN